MGTTLRREELIRIGGDPNLAPMFFPGSDVRASDQAEVDAEFGAGVKRAFWSCARELISSLR